MAYPMVVLTNSNVQYFTGKKRFFRKNIVFSSFWPPAEAWNQSSGNQSVRQSWIQFVALKSKKKQNFQKFISVKIKKNRIFRNLFRLKLKKKQNFQKIIHLFLKKSSSVFDPSFAQNLDYSRNIFFTDPNLDLHQYFPFCPKFRFLTKILQNFSFQLCELIKFWCRFVIKS